MNSWTNNAPKIYLVSVAIQALFSLLFGFLLDATTDLGIYLSYLLPQIANIGVILVACKLQRTPIKTNLPFSGKNDPLLFLLLIPLSAAFYAQNLLYADLFSWAMTSLGVPMHVAFPAGTEWWNILLCVLVIVVLPAIGEELMFRGVLPKTFETRGALSTVFLSALAFALAHGNLAQLVHQFLLGALLVYLTKKTENLKYAMGIHFLNNAIALILTYTLPAGALSDPTPANLGILFALFGGGVVVFYPLLALFLCRVKKTALRAAFTAEHAKEVFWFDEPERAGARPGAYEIAMWAFLVLLLTFSTVVGFLS